MNLNKKVALVKGENRKENLKRCLSLIQEDMELIKKAKNILVKPNLVAIKPDFANTHVESIEAVIEFIREMAPGTPITVGESSASAFYRGLSTESVFKDFDYYRIEKKYSNVSLTHFDKSNDFIQSPILSIVGDTQLRITKRAEGYDYKISLSIPKTHNFAMATFGIKNMVGLVIRQDMAMIHGMKGGIEVDAPKTILYRLPAGTVSRARKLLPNGLINFLFRQYPAYRRSVKMIHKNIAELAKRVWPDLVVLDGFVCMEGDGPVNGTPVHLKTAIASTDPIKADGIGARVIGFNPEEIGYLHYLQKENMGEFSLTNLVGDDLNKIKRKFTPHATFDIQSQWHDTLAAHSRG